MKKKYCYICDEEVILHDGKCSRCNTALEETCVDVKQTDEIDAVKEKKVVVKNNIAITNDDITNNINFFLKHGYYVKVFLYVIAVIMAILAIVLIDETDGLSLFLFLVSLSISGSGVIFENNLKWKAYMLYINMKRK